ncbi:hypothetical protein B0J18DRAFT_418973 [Chaetomium sp. MPI-SDFR-AT-0129]|nr:hypothetical protein B0J18DRAFT_418973 [Chaetomium sp. MPI-SDFR-AT-0129]
MRMVKEKGESVFYPLNAAAAVAAPGDGETEADEAETETETERSAAKDTLQTRPVYHTGTAPTTPWASTNNNNTLTIASYNVLAEFHHPPSSARHPLLLDNLLSSNADILLLQEVTDAFLSTLLSDPRIRTRYPFASHGPPSEANTEPLPSHLNVVVLSALEFDWEYVSLWRRHKGAVVARVNLDTNTNTNENPQSVVIAALHLNHGLTDGAVTVQRGDLKRLVGYLRATYPGQPWVLAGDFNISTSSVSIGTAVKKGTLSEVSRGYLEGLEEWLGEEGEGGFVDAWEVSKGDHHHQEGEEGDEDIAKGEEGATWDPTRNALAAAMAASGGNVRPQRYDRILVRGEGVLGVEGFSMFGFRTGVDEKGEPMYASDHWGVRCTLKVGVQENAEEEVEEEEEKEEEEEISEKIARLIVPVDLQRAPQPLAQPGSIHNALLAANIIPTPEDYAHREKALEFLRRVLLDSDSQGKGEPTENARGQPTVVVVPVGSYALDVWTPTSDMDVLCIGPFSTRTFFALASQRIRRAAASSSKKNNPEKETDTIRILRRVRANHGTMLELEVNHIKMDLQYCPATTVAERWPSVLKTPPSDPVWSLSAPTLSKLKAARDADYILRSVPDITVFRTAHRFLRAWAVARGVYAARFGFWSGIQLSILLARVYKLVSQDLDKSNNREISPEDLVTTFIHHYATFDWPSQLAFDPLFHRQRLPYTRVPSREPMAVLGYFPPALNTAQAASVPSVRTLVTELQHARDTLSLSPSVPSEEEGSATWKDLLTPTTTFLTAHKSYVRLDAQYWGLPPTRGARFLGWLESRCVGLLVDMHRRAPGVHARMWPGRFVVSEPSPQDDHDLEGDEMEGEGEGETSRDFRGCYLIGLDKADAEKTSREELQQALGALQTVLARFEAQMRGDEKYFDAGHCWVGAAVVSRAELAGLELDRREMGGYTAGEDEEDDDDDEEEEVEVMAGVGSLPCQESGEDTDHPKPRNKGKKNKQQPEKQTPIDLRADKTRKFRTAADALHRIRWDPHLDRTDYLVGYEDRFLGAQEKDLEGWKTEQTDEEFIPQHRILYFRRKSDGRVVWDRRTRWDELFGNV